MNSTDGLKVFERKYSHHPGEPRTVIRTKKYHHILGDFVKRIRQKVGRFMTMEYESLINQGIIIQKDYFIILEVKYEVL